MYDAIPGYRLKLILLPKNCGIYNKYDATATSATEKLLPNK